MGKFRKKPVVIDAWVWQESEAQRKELESLGMKCSSWNGHRDQPDLCNRMTIRTLEGNSYEVEKGEIIIRGVKGEFYPCKPDIFDLTYEKAEEL